jgi:2'-hydroxyisoflavone reductase
VFNAAGPVVRLADHLDTAREVAGHTGPVVPVDRAWLAEQGVQPWIGERSLPLWLDDPDWLGLSARDTGAARRAGMVTRPLAETLTDTLAWEQDQGADRIRGAGLTPAEERALLEAWRTPERPRV